MKVSVNFPPAALPSEDGVAESLHDCSDSPWFCLDNFAISLSLVARSLSLLLFVVLPLSTTEALEGLGANFI